MLDAHGESPLEHAEGSSLESVCAECLRSMSADAFPLHQAAIRGHHVCAHGMLQEPTLADSANEKDHTGRTPLVIAALSANEELLSILLRHGGDANQTFEGLSLFSLVLGRHGESMEASGQCERGALTLVQSGCSPSKSDREGSRPLHHAAARGLTALIELLLEKRSKGLDELDNELRTPLVVAASHGQAAAVRILQQRGSNANTVDFWGMSALSTVLSRSDPHNLWRDLLPCTSNETLRSMDAYGYTCHDYAVAAGRPDIVHQIERVCAGLEIEETEAMESLKSIPATTIPRTLLVYSKRCLGHASTGVLGRIAEPEVEERIVTIAGPVGGILRNPSRFGSLVWNEDPPLAALADVLRVHELEYVQRLRLKCASLDRGIAGRVGLVDERVAHALDGDTTLTSGSMEAALVAAGSVVAAVDAVVLGRQRNAFCCVRPPGHHAGPSGKIRSTTSDSHGFCLLNNVAIGAAYAMAAHRGAGIRRVAIVDFDVHHGNGTQAIVENLSLREKPSSETVQSQFGTITLRSWQCKPWATDHDSDNVLFASLHGFGHSHPNENERGGASATWFYPGSGDVDDNRTGRILNVPLRSPYTSVDFRTAFATRVLPQLYDFRPDLIMISAGFDGHRNDVLNMGIAQLTEEDYAVATNQLMRVANTTCNGRIVSVLEGGYRLQGGVCSALARSCAAHVGALMENVTAVWRPACKVGEQVALSHERLAVLAAARAEAKARSHPPDSSDGNHARPKRRRAEVNYALLAETMGGRE